MGVQQEYVRILTEVQGDQAVTNLEAQLAHLRQEIANLATQFRTTGVMSQQMQDQMQTLARGVAETKSMMDALKGVGGVSGQGMMGLSFAVQDFMSANGDLEQGLYRIQNNIPVLLNQLGAPAGLAGVISLVSLAVGAALPYIEKFVHQLAEGQAPAHALDTSLAGLQKTLKEFAANPPTTLVDTLTYENAAKAVTKLKEAHEEFQRVKNLETQQQKKEGAFFEEALAERAAGGIEPTQEEMRKRLAAQRIAQQRATGELKGIDEKYKEALSIAQTPGGPSLGQRFRLEQLTLGELGPDIFTMTAPEIADKIQDKIQVEKNKLYKAAETAVEEEVGMAEAAMRKGRPEGARKYIQLLEQAGMGEAQAALIGRLRQGLGDMGPVPPMLKDLPHMQQEQERAEKKAADDAKHAAKAIRDAKDNIQHLLAMDEHLDQAQKDILAAEMEKTLALGGTATDITERAGDVMVKAREMATAAGRKARDDHKLASEQKRDAQHKLQEARAEAHRIGAATNLDEWAEAQALAGARRSDVERALIGRGIARPVVEQMLDVANQKAKARALGPGGAPEALREVGESIEAKQEKLGKDIAAAQIKEAIRGGAYGAGPAGLPEDVLNQLIKGQVIPLMARGANADAAIITVLQQAVYNTQMLMMQYNTQQGILNNLNSIVAKQYNDMYRTQNGAQQHFLPHGGR